MFKYIARDGAYCLLCGLLLFGAALTGMPRGADAQVDRLDHFWCYMAEAPSVRKFVILRDQFDALDQRLQLGIVTRPIRFCNPVEKTVETGEVTPIVDPTHHLTLYLLFAFPAGQDRGFQVENQFGRQRIRTRGRPFGLAVPTEKDGGGEPKNLDHFKCYQAQGEPVDRVVGLRDQFQEAKDVDVRDPVFFCNPTLKFHAGAITPIENPDAHLTCYRTSPVPHEGLITARNQFGISDILIGSADTLCVPSKKILSTLPDLTIRLPTRVGVSCPGGGGTCTSTVDYEVREIGGVDVTAPFVVRLTNSVGQEASVTIPSLGAGGTTAGTLTLGPMGDNCYNPDCTTMGEVDFPSPGVIVEEREDNNTDTRFDMG